MFTVKFYKTTEEDGTICESFSCPHYLSHVRTNLNASIVIFKDAFDTEGVEFHVSPDYYDTCYIENMAGKTIDSYKAGTGCS